MTCISGGDNDDFMEVSGEISLLLIFSFISALLVNVVFRLPWELTET